MFISAILISSRLDRTSTVPVYCTNISYTIYTHMCNIVALWRPRVRGRERFPRKEEFLPLQSESVQKYVQVQLRDDDAHR